MSDTNSTVNMAVNEGLGTRSGNVGVRVNARSGGSGNGPIESFRILLQDGSGYVQLQDGTGDIELQDGP